MQRRADKPMLKRLTLIMSVLGIACFVIVVARLFVLQVLSSDEYLQMAISQQTRDITVYAQRGTIYDRNLKPLAISAPTHMVTLEASKIDGYTDPKTKEVVRTTDEEGIMIAQYLSEILDMDYTEVLSMVEARKTYCVVKRGVQDETCALIRAFVKENNLDSIYLVEDSTRYYPYGNFLSHVLGFVGTDQQGLAGLEYQYNSVLTGVNGRIVTATNNKGDEMPYASELYYEAEDGHSLVLTVDEVLQHYLEKNLEIAVNDNKVQNRAAGIVMDVNTGAVLAMATKGDFDPNDPMTIFDEATAAEVADIVSTDERRAARVAALNAQWTNKCISEAYYPGSTFKIITSAMAVEDDPMTVQRSYFCSGSTRVAEFDIKCWRHYNPHGTQTLAESLQNSCNCAFMQIGESLGIANFTKYFTAYGLRSKTGIDLPGESNGVYFTNMTPTDLAVGSFGQNFSVTPLQLVTAVSAVANGGTLYKPYVVSEIIDSEGNTVETVSPTVVRQVNSAYTSELICPMVESVVTHGTGGNAYTVGYRVAGKTGTTEKIDKKVNEEDETEYFVSSFIAFAPADDPQICLLVLLDEPTVEPITGGITVAPIIRRFMEEALPYLGVEPVYTEEELQQKDVVIPNLVGMTLDEAKDELKRLGITYETSGGGDFVTDQMPSAASTVSSQSKMVLYMGTEKNTDPITMPDLSGMTVDQVRRNLQNIGLYLKTEGVTYAEGGDIKVSKQDVEPGEPVLPGTVIKVEFSDYNQTSE